MTLTEYINKQNDYCPHCGSEWEQCDCLDAKYINRESAKNADTSE